MPRSGRTAGAAWTFVFDGGDLTSAMVRVSGGGDKVVEQARPLADGYWVVSCTDPQGVSFAPMSRKR